MSRRRGTKRRRLAVALGAIFLVAVVMGTGPGIYLVNPDPADPNAAFTFLGLPILYVWAVFWFFVQAAVVLVAYFTLWDGREHPDPPRPPSARNGD